MINLKKHFDLLGTRVVDRVTGYNGVVTSMTFDLYGCIQALVNPGIDATGKTQESAWFDVNRLVVVDAVPVMPQPQFDWSPDAISAGEKGPAERPRSMKP